MIYLNETMARHRHIPTERSCRETTRMRCEKRRKFHFNVKLLCWQRFYCVILPFVGCCTSDWLNSIQMVECVHRSSFAWLRFKWIFSYFHQVISLVFYTFFPLMFSSAFATKQKILQRQAEIVSFSTKT